MWATPRLSSGAGVAVAVARAARVSIVSIGYLNESHYYCLYLYLYFYVYFVGCRAGLDDIKSQRSNPLHRLEPLDSARSRSCERSQSQS